MVRRMVLLLAAAAFSFNGLLSAGDAAPEYPCQRLAAAPAMDSSDWSQLPEARAFFIHGGKDYAVEKRSSFRAGWTDDSLYLQVKCVEPLLDKVKITTAEGDALWADDAVEIFLQPATGPEYFQFIANSAGVRWNAVGPVNKEAKAWNWEARPGKWAEGWYLNARIPFAVLNKTPEPGSVWPVNVARDTTTGPDAERYTCWSPVRKGFNDLGRFGSFVFCAAAPQAKEVEARLDGPFHQYLKEQRAAKVQEAGKAELLAALDNPALAAEARPVKEVLARLSQPADPQGMALQLVTWRNLMTLLAEKAKQLDIPLVKTPRLDLAFGIEARQAKDLKLWVNGRAVEGQGGKWPVVLREGLNVVALAATADGPDAGLRLDIPGHSELAGRWRVGAPANDAWLAAAFDDRAWKKAELDKDGYLRLPSGQAALRQLVLWGETHYSGLPCLTPKAREWGFSEKSLETLFHVLYSPLGFPLEDYEFTLDVPKGFSLLEEKDTGKDKGGRLNRRPSKIATEETTHDSQPYTRYRFSFDPKVLQPDKRECSLIPLLLGEHKGADKLCKFYFRRTASGNLTELEQTLPVRVLPPINGKMPKRVLLTMYCASPWRVFSGGRVFPEHFKAYMRQALDAGLNGWVVGSWEGEYGRNVHDKVVERGGTVVLCYNNYPIHGNNLGAKSALGKWMQSTPETQAKFFNGTSTWTKDGQYCPSFVTGEGKDKFKEAVKKDIGAMLHGGPGSGYIGMPGATIYWADWEEEPWIAAGMGYEPARTGDGSYCFCDRCKEAFRNYAKLPADADLSDTAIFKNYKLDWSAFRNGFDGRINGLTREVCNELGLQYIVYSGTNQTKFFESCKGEIDSAFPGCPGDGRADAEQQRGMDNAMEFFQEKTGLRSVLGQLFASSYDEGGSLNWNGSRSWSEDGFVNAKTVKPQILRTVASLHGGVDLNGGMERCAGQMYYIGEATRALSEYEDLFKDGERADQLAESEQLKYPNLLVLKKGKERLVLLFNEGKAPLRVMLRNKGLAPGQTAEIFGVGEVPGRADAMELTVEPEDVALVHIRGGGFPWLF